MKRREKIYPVNGREKTANQTKTAKKNDVKNNNKIKTQLSYNQKSLFYRQLYNYTIITFCVVLEKMETMIPQKAEFEAKNNFISTFRVATVKKFVFRL